MFAFHKATMDRKQGTARLPLAFFHLLGERMPDEVGYHCHCLCSNIMQFVMGLQSTTA